VIGSLQRENAELQKHIQHLIVERDESQSKNLVMEQLYEGAEKQKKEMVKELED
jgi:hypothetical protein